MIIENPDLFKSWLTSILEPLCDADPAALAKYVYALVKKDKPLDELREGMLDQLDVFLQHETKPFVEMLFKSLETDEYLKSADKLPSNDQTEHTEKYITDQENNVVVNGADGEAKGAAEQGAAPRTAKHRVVVPRAPVRAPPHEQTLVKVLPLNELLEEPVDQLPRRRDRRIEAGHDRRRRRSRSWERRARPRRHARPDMDQAADARKYDKRRIPSRSPSPRGRYRNRSPPPSDRPLSRSRSRSPPVMRDHERERDRVRVVREMERDRMSRDRDHREPRERERSRDRSRERSMSPSQERDYRPDHYKRRCRDFDEKGYCMRGDLCKWDHGADPVVLEDATLTRVLAIPPPVPEYNPLTPDIWCGAAGVGYPPFPHPPHLMPPRELIPIPRIRPMQTAPVPLVPRHPPPRKNFDYVRLGAPRPPLGANAQNSSLVVRKVPKGLNDITHLNNHFAKFGKIVNIQVNFEGDPEAALVTFSNRAEASVAYKSTEAVLNNRFIRLFWHAPESKQEAGQQAKPGEKPSPPVAAAAAAPHATHHKVFINAENMRATAEEKEKAKEAAAASDAAAANNNSSTEGENPKPLAKAAPSGRQAMEAQRKRAQALLDTALQQQRLLIERLESGNMAAAQKQVLMEAINSGQEGIEKLRKELVAYNNTIRQIQTAKKPKSREEAQKEILDMELDLFTRQQEGGDVTELARRIADLRRALALQYARAPPPRRTHARGGRFASTRFVRGAAASAAGGARVFVNQSVDHRPRTLLVSGFEADELDALLAHFSQFGEVSGHEVNPAVPELVLQYKARPHAEAAAAKGKHYNDRTLSITWVSNMKPIGSAAAAATTAPQVPTTEPAAATPPAEQQQPSPQVVVEDALRFDEEEDEELEETRSWRR